MWRGLAFIVALLALCASAAAAPASGTRPRVTLISDSVGASLGWDGPAGRIFEQGLRADLELQGCRRLVTTSCPAGTVIPPSALELIRRLGSRLGPNVIIDVGYNDYPTVYAPGIERVLRALRASARRARLLGDAARVARAPTRRRTARSAARRGGTRSSSA